MASCIISMLYLEEEIRVLEVRIHELIYIVLKYLLPMQLFVYMQVPIRNHSQL